MTVRVNETRREHQALGEEYLVRLKGFQVTHCNDPLAVEADIARISRRSAAIDNQGVSDQLSRAGRIINRQITFGSAGGEHKCAAE